MLFDVDLAAATFEDPESEVSSLVEGERAEDLERFYASNCICTLCPCRILYSCPYRFEVKSSLKHIVPTGR